MLHGALTIDRGEGDTREYSAGESWHEGADDPVLAIASATEDTAFVRVLLLPAEWAGRRTVTYVDPADEDKPRLQRATILLEVAL
jgi:quercetin dioxygenase-like cupin family protein